MPQIKPNRTHFILSIWNQGADQQVVWRGYIETAVGDRTYFSNLQQLNTLLTQFGWSDNPKPARSHDQTT